MALAARQSVQGRTWQAVNELLLSHYRDVSAPVASRRRAG
jgi:phosphatidylinositol alpha 1,6-mannosyltransferase